MLDLIRSMYGWPLRGWVALITVLLVILFMNYLFPRASGLTGSCKNNVVDLQKAHTVERFVNVLLSWSKNSGKADAVRVMKRENIIKLDLLFPFIYALALAFSYACARGNREPSTLDLIIFLCPLVAGLFDLIENSIHLYLLSGVNTEEDVKAASFSPALVFTASAFARVKFVLLLVSAVAIIGAIVGRLREDG